MGFDAPAENAGQAAIGIQFPDIVDCGCSGSFGGAQDDTLCCEMTVLLGITARSKIVNCTLFIAISRLKLIFIPY